MSFPRVRLTINCAEYELLKPGLDFIACQLASAKLGLRTNHHPLVRVDPQLANIYKRKQYSEEGDQAVISIRAKLWELTSSRKIRANFLELSAAALALRTLHRLPDSKRDPIAAKALASNLRSTGREPSDLLSIGSARNNIRLPPTAGSVSSSLFGIT